jgi:hypothetical protein
MNNPLIPADFVARIDADKNEKKTSEKPRWNLRQSADHSSIVIS